jgi:hypothetical protein
MIWLIVGAVLCIVFGYSVGRGSGKEHTINRLTRQYRRGLERDLRVNIQTPVLMLVW